MPFIQVLERVATASVAASAAIAPSAMESLPPSTTNLPNPSTTGDVPSSTPSNSGNGGSGGSSPLLFFVALGFGVVFTNLWIIVGVKYCFRYNARARAMRLAAEDGEPINMDNVPPHPRRRRREKKLMSIDEVNEKFPMMKYKTWVSSRAMEGLPTRGGVDAPSRPNSIRSVAGAMAPVAESPDLEITTTATTMATTTMADKDTAPSPVKAPEVSTTAITAAAAGTSDHAPADGDDSKGPDVSVYNSKSDEHSRHSEDGDGDGDDDDEHIDSALPPECVGTSGDTCAICIDTLEDDDDVRGLTCGHAFHAVCLDPWLTSRRACCPLCKADYYTPKPRDPPSAGAGAVAGAGAAGAAEAAGGYPNVQAVPASGAGGVDAGFVGQSRLVARPVAVWPALRIPSSLQNRFMGSRGRQDVGSSRSGRSAAPRATQRVSPNAAPRAAAASRFDWVNNLRPFNRRQGEQSSAAGTTPSQLEAGVRP